VSRQILALLVIALSLPSWAWAARESGVVLSYAEDKSYGFIKPDSGGKDVFVHRSAVESRDRPCGPAIA
jgi:hypothetical protein